MEGAQRSANQYIVDIVHILALPDCVGTHRLA